VDWALLEVAGVIAFLASEEAALTPGEAHMAIDVPENFHLI
jgi:hypothetical protein